MKGLDFNCFYSFSYIESAFFSPPSRFLRSPPAPMPHIYYLQHPHVSHETNDNKYPETINQRGGFCDSHQTKSLCPWTSSRGRSSKWGWMWFEKEWRFNPTKHSRSSLDFLTFRLSIETQFNIITCKTAINFLSSLQIKIHQKMMAIKRRRNLSDINPTVNCINLFFISISLSHW